MRTRGLAYLGVALLVLGFALLAYTWGQVAGRASVPFQIPYLVSGGISGLAFILMGLTALNVYVKFRDGERRDHQIEQLSQLLDQIRVLLGGEEREPAAEVASDAAEPDDAPEGAPTTDTRAADTDEDPLVRVGT